MSMAPAIAHAKELEAGRRYGGGVAGRSFRVARRDRGQARQRDRCTALALVPWHVPSFCKRHARQHLSIWLATIATTAIAVKLRDAKSESITKSRAARCRALGDSHAASKLRRKDSVPSICAAMLCGANPTAERQHHANRSHH